MPGWRDEIEAGVDTGVGQRHSVDPGLGIQELLVARLYEVDDRVPALGVVDGISESLNWLKS